MATTLTRFEIELPEFASGSPQDIAVQQFLGSIQTLCDYLQYPATRVTMAGVYQQCVVLYGLLTTAQQSTALGFLTTLNAALTTPVICVVFQVQQEP